MNEDFKELNGQVIHSNVWYLLKYTHSFEYPSENFIFRQVIVKIVNSDASF